MYIYKVSNNMGLLHNTKELIVRLMDQCLFAMPLMGVHKARTVALTVLFIAVKVVLEV